MVEQEQDNSVEEKAEEPSQPTISAGKLLVEARQKLGIELADLAEQIRVPLSVLEAIEIDRVPKDLPETFIRGYIRSYAKKVNIDEALVLPPIETTGAVESTPKQMQSFSRRNKRKALEKRLVYFTWFMAISLLIAVVTWWLQDNEKSNFAPVVETQTDASLSESVDHESNTPIQHAIEVKKQPVITSNSNTAESIESEQSNLTSVQGETTIPLTAAQKAIVADNGEPDEDGFLKIEMKFESECWVELYDVFGERVAVGNKPAGYLMTVNAQGPLNVILGNPVGVSIWVNGKEFDTSELPSNRVARFELEQIN